MLQKHTSDQLLNLSATGFRITHQRVSNSSNIPTNLPADVEKAFLQAETNFAQNGHEEAAATMYRRALERALKAAFPTLQGTLAARIKGLVANGTLPPILAEWATEIRVIGNDGAHDDEVEMADLVAARAFTDAFLRYLISLPEEIKKRRQPPKP